MAGKSYDYDIAFSFAGADKEYVSKVAEELKKYNIRVFYHNFEQARLWSIDLQEHLAGVYSEGAKYNIAFLSAHYADREWTQFELSYILGRTESSPLLVRFDDTVFPDISSSIAYADARQYDPWQLVHLILEKMGYRSTAANTTVLRYNTYYDIDFNFLLGSFHPYRDWDTFRIAQELPVTVLPPFNVAERIRTYPSVAAAVKISRDMSGEAIRQVSAFYSESSLSERFFDPVAAMVRQVLSLYMEEEIDEAELRRMIRTYACTKLMSLIGGIMSFRLKNTVSEPWISEFHSMPASFEANFMEGLLYFLKKTAPELQVLFWTNVDLNTPNNYVRRIGLPDKVFMTDTWPKVNREMMTGYLFAQLFEHYRGQAHDDFPILLRQQERISVSPRKEWWYRTDKMKELYSPEDRLRLRNDFEQRVKQEGLKPDLPFSFWF